MELSKRAFLRTDWNLAWPYWIGEEKWSARALLAAVVALGMVLWIVMGLSGDLGSPEVWQR